MMAMEKYEHGDIAYGNEKTVETQPAIYEWAQWIYYPDYDVIPFRFVSGIMSTCQRYSIRR